MFISFPRIAVSPLHDVVTETELLFKTRSVGRRMPLCILSNVLHGRLSFPPAAFELC